MFPNRRLSLSLMLSLMMLVCSSTALASAYEIDRPDSTPQLSSQYSPLLFGAFISNLAGHLRLGNDQVTARSSELVFDLDSLALPGGHSKRTGRRRFPTQAAERRRHSIGRARRRMRNRSPKTLAFGTPMRGSGH